MPTDLACIGIDVADPDELERVGAVARERASRLGERAGRRAPRRQDDDGARLVLVVERTGRLGALTPSADAEPGAEPGDMTDLAEECWSAVVLQDGEKVGPLAADVERSALLAAGAGGRAGIVALGTDVQVLPDPATVEASPASLADGRDDDPPARRVEEGWRWPPRMGAESFASLGLLGPPTEATARTHLDGVVLRSRTCRNSLTGAAFHVVRVRTGSLEADVCLAVEEHRDAPPPGAVVTGTVDLVVALELPPARPGAGSRRRGLRLLRRR